MFKLICLFIGLSFLSSVGFSMTAEKCLESSEEAVEVCGGKGSGAEDVGVGDPAGIAGDFTSRDDMGRKLGASKKAARKAGAACKTATKAAKKDHQAAKSNGGDPAKLQECEENIKKAEEKQAGLDKMGDDLAKKEQGNEEGKKSSEGEGKMPDLSSLLDALKKKDEPKPEEKAPDLKADPNNCSSPAGAGSKVCICQANPRNPGCDGAQTSTTDDSGVRTKSPSASNGGGLGSGFRNDSKNSSLESPPPPRSGATGIPPGGGSGGGGVGSGQGSAGGGVPKNDPYQSPFRADSSGGGGGGGGPVPGSGLKGVDSKSIAPVGGRIASYTVKGGRKPASIGGTGADGITGPQTNLFHKVRVRYYFLRSSLKQ